MATKTILRKTNDIWEIHTTGRENSQPRQQEWAMIWGETRNLLGMRRIKKPTCVTRKFQDKRYIFTKEENNSQYNKTLKLMKNKTSPKPGELKLQK